MTAHRDKHFPIGTDVIMSSTATELESIASQAGTSIADSVLARVNDFPKRESLLKSWMKNELESVPSQILWHGLEDEAAPVFVVYKLLHEAFSNSPSFFRRFITSIMAAQSERFSTVFSRETLWSVIARAPQAEIPADWTSPSSIRCLLEGLNKKSFWRRSDDELQRDADSIHIALTKNPDATFKNGVEALRRLQSERATGLTNGNLVLLVPAKLNQYVSEVAHLGMHGNLPELAELCAKVHEVVRDPLAEGRHLSIPIDVLFTDLEGENLECFVLVREKANETEQIALRKNSLLVRYFLKYAFSAYDFQKLHVRFAFYLDPGTTFSPLPKPASLFHPKELVSFHDFWQIVAGKPDGAKLIFKARDAAAEKLKSSSLMARIKDHFSRDRKSKPGTRSALFSR